MDVRPRAARLHAVGVTSSDNGRPALAVRQLRAGLRLIDSGPARDDPALLELRCRLLLSLAWAESERGRVEAGFRLLDEAERITPAAQRPVLHGQRALLLKRTGRNDQALREYDAAVALLSEDSPLDLVKALNNRSLVHLEAGDVRLARGDLRRCGQIAARHGLALHVALSRVNLGCLDVLAGDLPAALGAFTAARGDYERLAPGRLPSLAVERARALVAAGLFAEADRELAAAIEQATHQRMSHTRADLLGRDNARRAALASLLELRAEQAAGAPPAEIAVRAQSLAVRLHRLGLAEDARAAALVATRALVSTGQLRRAWQIADRYGPPGRVDRLDTRLLWRLARAELATAAGRPAEASRHLASGMAALHRHRTQFGCLDLQTGAAVHGRDLARVALARALASGSPAAIYRWSERVRAQALLVPPVLPPDDPTAAAALEELRQIRHALRAAELAGRPAAGLRSRAESLQRTIREHTWSTPGKRGAAAPAPAPLAAVKESAGDAALVIYLRDGPALRALVVAGGSASLVTLGEFAAVAEAALRLRADLDAQAGHALSGRLATAVAAATSRDAHTLSGAILGPFLSVIGDRDLVVVPTGILMTVPWSVLPGCGGRPVTVAPSATTWLAARRRLGSCELGPQAATLLVAGPGNARGPAEVQAVAALRPRAAVLLGTGATPAATLAALSEVSVAHLAAHGRHQAENALFSTLELTAGPLLGYDLQQIPHTPPMVVLSSCDLGLTDIRPGDETLGMVTALLSAGSATVVASVARVADDTAADTMAGFHRAIVAGCPPAAALARAARQPAGFVCFGAG